MEYFRLRLGSLDLVFDVELRRRDGRDSLAPLSTYRLGSGRMARTRALCQLGNGFGD